MSSNRGMEIENFVYTKIKIFIHEEGSPVFCWKMDTTGDSYTKRLEYISERQIPHAFSHLWVPVFTEGDSGGGGVRPKCTEDWNDNGLLQLCAIESVCDMVVLVQPRAQSLPSCRVRCLGFQSSDSLW